LGTSYIPSCVLNQVQQFQQDFQQFGQDLKSGNLSAAQSDIATLHKEVPQYNCPQTLQCDSQLAQASNQLALGPGQGNSAAAPKQRDDSTNPPGYGGQISRWNSQYSASGGSQPRQVSPWSAPSAGQLPAGNTSHAQSEYISLAQIFQDAGRSPSASASNPGHLSIHA
jgi:hypothetical protein